ncbi:hypothetical protein [uncultured Gimesia sp.]|uniref:hypothetical protein n=1 Tax=uncultured Gimesia sp. TaxID=1678688 RepID=UPI0030D8B058
MDLFDIFNRKMIAGALVFALCLMTGSVSVLQAQGKRNRKGNDVAEQLSPADYRSKNFLIHTDLPPTEARDLLERLEKMLVIISTYWGSPNRRVIECYVVKDLVNWPPRSLHPTGLRSVAGGGGVTMSQTTYRGRQIVAAKSIVYATATRGTPQHEAVHAYCAQNFGRTGPIWYSEGMAEMGNNWKVVPKKGQPLSVSCERYVIDYIKRSEPKSLNEIVNSRETTGDSWQNYCWRWALCHLLATNPNYAARFRPLGLGLLMNKSASFNQTYGSMAREISFEYLFFLKHFDQGYRCDLCQWDWKTKFRKPNSVRPLASKIEANQGWQASRTLVEAETEYQFSADGEWKTARDTEPVTAKGSDEGQGALVGIVLTKTEDDEYELSEEFELGESGRFEAPVSGKLFLRCRDEWHELADNSGKIAVKISE